jgi:phage gpG-like protein
MAIVYAPSASPKEVAARFRAMMQRASDLSAVLKNAAEDVKLLMLDSFEFGVSPDGTPWKPNAQSTIDRKKSSKPGINIGDLRLSVTASATKNSLSFGTNKPYAGDVQWGSTRTGNLKNASYKGGTKRDKGSAFTVKVEGRAFVPMLRDGNLMTQGAAKALFDSITKSVMLYITTGKIT